MIHDDSHQPTPSQAAENFAKTVMHFCEWAEGKDHDLVEARQHLIALMHSIPRVIHYRNTGESADECPRRGHDRWKEDLRLFSDLPFQNYQVVFDPHGRGDEPVTGDLHDDLADIFGDLWSGLQVHRSGNSAEALALWVDSYVYHWGQHASSALHAIDTFYRQNLS